MIRNAVRVPGSLSAAIVHPRFAQIACAMESPRP
jgi:hypothetical protein